MPESKESGGWLLAAVLVALVALVALDSCGGPGQNPEPEPTPVDTSAQVVAAVMDGLAPVLDSVAESVGAGTESSLTDTSAAHPEPGPSLLDVLFWLGLICCLPTALLVSALVFVLLRDKQVVRSALLFLGMLYHKRQEERVDTPGAQQAQEEINIE